MPALQHSAGLIYSLHLSNMILTT